MTLRYLLPLLAAGIIIFGPGTARAALTLFDFSNGDLSTASGPGSMFYLDDGSASTQSGTQFGTTASFGLPTIAGQVADIMFFPGVSGADNGYRIDHGFADNDGPTAGFLDTYTFGIDFYIDTAPAGDFVGIFNSTEANSNDAEIWLDFSNGTGGFWRQGDGANSVAQTTSSIALDVWTRTIFRVENSATLDIFVNGVQVANDLAWDSGDSLYTTDSVSPLGGGDFSILGDGTGFHGAGYVSSIAIWDEALTDQAIGDFGAATAQGFSLAAIPEPRYGGLLALASFALLLLRRRRPRFAPAAL